MTSAAGERCLEELAAILRLTRWALTLLAAFGAVGALRWAWGTMKGGYDAARAEARRRPPG